MTSHPKDKDIFYDSKTVHHSKALSSIPRTERIKEQTEKGKKRKGKGKKSFNMKSRQSRRKAIEVDESPNTGS